MGLTQQNDYEVGVNNDLSNALLNIDINRIPKDLTILEDDAGTLKVSVGSLIEANGSLWVVDTAAETPVGTPTDGYYLYFDDATPQFEWLSTAGTWSSEKQGWYSGTKRRCRWRLTDASEEAWALLLPNCPPAAGMTEIQFGAVRGNFEKGREVAGSIYSTAYTLGDIYDDLANEIPEIGDSIIVSGMIYQAAVGTGGPWALHRAVRNSSTVIYLYGMLIVSSFNPVQFTLSTGLGPSDNYYISMAW